MQTEAKRGVRFKSFQRDWYNALACSQGISRYNPNFDGKITQPLLKNFVDIVDMHLLNKLDFVKGNKVLDAGCNSGIRLNHLASRFGIEGTGIDISSEAIKLANGIKHPFNNYCVSDAEKLPFPAGYFERIISFGLIEHLPHPVVCLREFSRVLGKGGRIIIATVNKNDRFTLHWLVQKVSFGILGRESARCATHNTDYFLDMASLCRMLEEGNFEVIDVFCSHSFFLLFYDELIYSFLVKAYKFLSDIFGKEKIAIDNLLGQNKRTAPLIFRIYAKMLIPLYYAAEYLDRAWKRWELSYYLYVIAQKK